MKTGWWEGLGENWMVGRPECEATERLGLQYLKPTLPGLQSQLALAVLAVIEGLGTKIQKDWVYLKTSAMLHFSN